GGDTTGGSFLPAGYDVWPAGDGYRCRSRVAAPDNPPVHPDHAPCPATIPACGCAATDHQNGLRHPARHTTGNAGISPACASHAALRDPATAAPHVPVCDCAGSAAPTHPAVSHHPDPQTRHSTAAVPTPTHSPALTRQALPPLQNRPAAHRGSPADASPPACWHCGSAAARFLPVHGRHAGRQRPRRHPATVDSADPLRPAALPRHTTAAARAGASSAPGYREWHPGPVRPAATSLPQSQNSDLTV